MEKKNNGIEPQTNCHYFMSDLHKFSRRSHSERHEAEIRDAAAKAKTFVLGGDIFDFRWSTIPTLEKTIDAALRWLDDLTQPCSHCDFHYVLGNHDFNLPFMEQLEEFAAVRDNFNWHRYYHRIGDCMFLHGDVPEGEVSHEELIAARQKSHHEKQPHVIQHYLYDVAVQLRAHKAIVKSVNRKEKVAGRIFAYLQEIGHGPENGLQHVYFGHTHMPMGAYEYEGLRFHNGGAPIKHLDFRILEVPIAVTEGESD